MRLAAAPRVGAASYQPQVPPPVRSHPSRMGDLPARAQRPSPL